MRILIYIGVVILAVAAGILGYNIYKSRLSQTPLQEEPTTQSDTQISQPSPQPTQSFQINPTNETATEAERKLLRSIPFTQASLEERTKFSDEVTKYAKEASLLEITNSTPIPVIIKVRPNTDLQIKNNDEVEHKIVIGDQTLNVASKSTGSIRIGSGDKNYLTTYLIFVNGIGKGFVSIK